MNLRKTSFILILFLYFILETYTVAAMIEPTQVLASDSVKITQMTQEPVAISIPQTCTLKCGDSWNIPISLVPTNAQTNYRISSSNRTVAPVWTTGGYTGCLVEARSPGNSTLVVTTNNGLSAICELTVIDSDEEIIYTFITNGGSVVNSIEGKILTCPITEKADEQFLGWYDNSKFIGEKIVFPYSGRGTTLYAKWKPIVYTTINIYSSTTENTLFKIGAKNIEDGNVVIFASYKDGKLMYLDLAEYNKDDYLLFQHKNEIEYDVIKVFVMDNLHSLRPVCESIAFCKNHNLSSNVVDCNPTCVSAGKYKDRYCLNCGELFKGDTIPALGHTEVMDKRIEPTCTTVGYDGGTHCSVCGSVVKEQVEIPVLGHTEVIIPAVTSTCIKTGLTEGKYCSVCDATIVPQQELAKVPHSIKNGRCIYCSAAKDVLKSEELVREAERHKAKVEEINGWYAWVIELNQSRINELKSAHNITYVYDNITCVQEINSLNSQISSLDYQISRLEIYNDPADREEIASLKRQKSSLEAKKAKYEAMKDINAYEQTLLSHQDTYNERINAENSLYERNKNLIVLKYNNDSSICSNHTWGEWECVSEASCLTIGVNTRYCSVCALVDNEIISKLNHEFVVDAYVAPTCIKTGLTEGSHCSLCKTVFVEQKTISKISHSYKSCKCEYCGLIDYKATFNNLKNYIVENGTKVDGKTYCLELGQTVDKQQYATYTYIRKNYYNIDNDTITLSVDVLANSVWSWKIDIIVPSISESYKWSYLDEVDAYMEGTIYANSFSEYTSYLNYSYTNITSSQTMGVREMAAYFVDLLCSNMKYDYSELGFTQKHLGFSKY